MHIFGVLIRFRGPGCEVLLVEIYVSFGGAVVFNIGRPITGRMNAEFESESVTLVSGGVPFRKDMPEVVNRFGKGAVCIPEDLWIFFYFKQWGRVFWQRNPQPEMLDVISPIALDDAGELSDVVLVKYQALESLCFEEGSPVFVDGGVGGDGWRG